MRKWICILLAAGIAAGLMSGCSRNVGTQESAVWQVLETEILAEKADASGEVDFTHDYSEEIKADIEDVVSKSESLQKELEQINTIIQKFTPLAEKAETQGETEAQAETEAQTEKPASDAKFAFEIVSTAMSTDYEGKSVLVVEYNFTNNSDETTSFTFACQDKVFQNGIECDSSVIGCDDVDSQMQLTDIQPGTTYTLKVGYHAESGAPVDIQITSLFGDETYLEQTVEI